MTTDSFDERAATWDDDPTKVDRARVVAAAVRAAVDLGSSLRVLEYGAGTGLLSQELAASVGPITLADTSRGMLEVLRSKASAGLFADATIWDLDLSRDAVPEERFDLVVTLMALHHIRDLDPVLEGFAALLEEQGTLCVIDLEREDGSFHGPDFDGHPGFDRDELAGLLTTAGFGETRFERCYELARDGRAYGLFLATCRRGASTPSAPAGGSAEC